MSLPLLLPYTSLNIAQLLGIEFDGKLIQTLFDDALKHSAEDMIVWLEYMTPKDTTQLSQSWYYISATRNTLPAARTRAFAIAQIKINTQRSRFTKLSSERKKSSRYMKKVMVSPYSRGYFSSLRTGKKHGRYSQGHDVIGKTRIEEEGKWGEKRVRYIQVRHSFDKSKVNDHILPPTFEELSSLASPKSTSVGDMRTANRATVIVGNITDYAAYVNYGHYANGTYVPGKFFMEAALSALVSDMMFEVGSVFNDIIDNLNNDSFGGGARYARRSKFGRFKPQAPGSERF